MAHILWRGGVSYNQTGRKPGRTAGPSHAVFTRAVMSS